jgi:dihydropteroate synthase
MARELQVNKESRYTRYGDTVFRWGLQTYIMGIVNVSSDSFSGDGCSCIDEAISKACQMEKDGADIIDVGGESTRPDAAPISVDEEIQRVIPFIKEMAGILKVPISVDTYKAEVARRALEVGAVIVNDISGMKKEPEIARVVAEMRAVIILTSNERGKTVSNIMNTVIANLRQQIQVAQRAGIDMMNIIVDPGIGFGKTVEQNLEIINRLDELKVLDRPLLLGTSRKSFIGNTLGLPVDERLEGSLASIAIGVSKGVDIVRVHDVRPTKLVCMMSDAICRSKS